MPDEIRAELAEHARAEAPNEACGLIVLSAGHAERYIRGRNALASPYRYRLEVDAATERVVNFLNAMTMEIQMLARCCGKSDVHNLEPEDLCALTIEAAAMARVPLAGTNWIPGQGF